MLNKLIVLAAASLLPAIAGAGDFEALIGNWVSPDGFARQSFSRTFDGSLIETRMWFRSGSGWRLVAAGSTYRRPEDKAWRSVSRTRDMDDIELFESTIVQTSMTIYRVANVAYKSDGTVIETDEEWVFLGNDHIKYTVFRFEEGSRVAWMRGEWIREKEQS